MQLATLCHDLVDVAVVVNARSDERQDDGSSVQASSQVDLLVERPVPAAGGFAEDPERPVEVAGFGTVPGQVVDVHGKRVCVHSGQLVSHNGPQLDGALADEMLVRVDPEDPCAKAVLEACVAGPPEIVVPIAFDDLGSRLFCDFDGRIRGTGVVYDNFVDEPLERLEAPWQGLFLVFHDQAG